ncbi:PH domain-containing protein [Micromonospora sp. ALFpr18c]|uniref:PH domain-containing protein n=1 Tax=unclassified Micromonospora TaxID=2617518 RepID=UPI00124B8D0A|nr:PH domain-containing protein [Micromonospora sp. ALFpr18c]KAB1941644.1 PH domain-containing protein [Micromonospora sp. ALFpr18c]
MDEISPARQWRVPASLPAAKLAGAVLLIALGLLFADGDTVRLVLAILAAAVVAGWAVRDLIAPVRLAADPDGLSVIHGFAGHRLLPWTTIEAITVDRRPRMGLTSEVLEIDTGESLHLFGRFELGATPEEVAAELRAARQH